MRARAYVSALFFVLTVLFNHNAFAENPPAAATPSDPKLLKEQYEKLQRDYEMLAADRDNVLIQSKKFIQYKAKALEAEEALNKALKERDQAKSDLESRTSQNQLLQEKLQQLEAAQEQISKEKEDLKNYIEKMEIEYRIVKETRNKISDLTKENTNLMHKFQSEEEKISKADHERLDALAEVEVYRRQMRDVNKKFDQALAKNKVLEKKIEEMPKRFTELARENKVLLKQTALMHYNLGVFYVQNKEFQRAIAELEKAIELNPDDAYAHFNLGYIYAEYIVDRHKAIEQFRQFLRLSKSDDKDVDWVKRYIITWQTWEGKKPIN